MTEETGKEGRAYTVVVGEDRILGSKPAAFGIWDSTADVAFIRE